MMQAFCKEWEAKLGVKITISQVRDPASTCGYSEAGAALRSAAAVKPPGVLGTPLPAFTPYVFGQYEYPIK